MVRLAVLSAIMTCLPAYGEPGLGRAPSPELTPAEEDGRYGYADAADKIVIPARFGKVVNHYPDSKYCSKVGRYLKYCRRKAAEKKEELK